MDVGQLEKRTMQGVWFLPVWLRNANERTLGSLKFNDYHHRSSI